MNFNAFPAYTEYRPIVPVCCATPHHGATIHRFFDTSPISSDGRYLAVCQLPFENRLPSPGDAAYVVVVDLENGEERIVCETRGWGIQVGANLQWGGNRWLYYNDVDERNWSPCLVQLDLYTGKTRRMGKGVFMLSPDGRYALTHNLAKSRITQQGYGVAVPDAYLTRNDNLPQNDGFFLTDTANGRCRLMMPLAQLIMHGIEKPETFAGGAFYGFQCKWSPDGQRIMYVVRWLPNDGGLRRAMVFTSDKDGGDIHLALHYKEWAKGGHHVNWHPDSHRITMNLILNSDHLKLVSFGYDGSQLHPIMDNVFGSGHPSYHRDGRFILTDAYVDQDLFAYADGSVAIRLIDTEKQTEQEIIRMKTRTGQDANLRLDPHPAWSKDGRYIVFNGFATGTRRVYIADLSRLLEEE